MSQQRLPQIEERVPRVFLSALRANAETNRILNKEGLLAALQHLQEINVSIPGHQRLSTTRLLHLTQACFPKHSSLTVPQYKQRSTLKMLEDMETLQKMRQSPTVAMYGDSMFERLSRQRLLNENSQELFNFSVGGDGVEHLKCRMALAHRTYFAETSTFVVLIGVNNVMGARRGNESDSAASSPAEIAKAISHIVQLILENSSNKVPPTVYLCKLLYVLGSETLDAHIINQKVDQVNAILEKIPQQLAGCRLVNNTMAVEAKNYDKDGLHLSKIGYRTLVANLPESVREQATTRLLGHR